MSAEALLSELRDRGVRLAAHGNDLDIDGPADVLTDDLLEELRRRKEEILSLVSARCQRCHRDPETALLCRRCGLGVDEAEAFLESLPEEAWEDGDLFGPPSHERPEPMFRCNRCRKLEGEGIPVLACSECDVEID